MGKNQDPDHISESLETINLILMSCSAAQPRRTLADLIMEKITEKKTEIESQMSDTTQNKYVLFL
jgi:hypothetical protein